MQATTTLSSATRSNAGFIWIKLAVVYLIIGISIGMAMGASHNFTLRPVHAHINLLGFVTLTLSGLIYSLFPAAGESKLAKVHFWMMNGALPFMMLGLAGMLLGYQQTLLVMIVAEFVLAGSVIAFAANLFINLK
ncbi:MAG: cytochrome-c oxidase [Pseudomonadota bacterium]